MTDSTVASTLLEDLRRRLGDRYEIVRELGRGGMGTVLLARDRSLDRPVALKVLPPEFAAQSDLRERFLRETRMAAGFSHPNIVPVFAVEDRDGLLAFAMGFVEGESLAQRVRRSGPLTTRETVRLLQDVGYALSYAHGRGVVHRDIKPDNIMLERATGRAMLMDFGIARTVGATPAANAGLTRVGEVVGTPEFMSPEQASGDVVDGRSDLYSLGLVAFFAVTGQLAITGETAHAVLTRQFTQPVPPVATLRPDLPPALAAALDRLVLKEPAARFASAEALVENLESAQLAGPDVPLPVRLLAQDLAQLGLVTIFILIIALQAQQLSMLRGRADLDIALPAVFLVAVLWGRFATTIAAARRVVEAGFAPSDILAGFGRLLDERESERARLRMRPEVRRRRRFSVRMFVGMIVTALLLIAVAMRSRVEVAPGLYRVPRPMVVMLVSAAILLGMALIGLLRTPFRATVGERLFRVVWMGWLGRTFLQLAGRGAASPPSPSAAAVVHLVAPTTPVQLRQDGVAHTGQAASEEAMRLARLEARVEALERAKDPTP
jgi:serine/threonine-protein kinase